MELNMLSNAVNVIPMANMLFIFTIDKSRLLTFNFSSWRSAIRNAFKTCA